MANPSTSEYGSNVDSLNMSAMANSLPRTAAHSNQGPSRQTVPPGMIPHSPFMDQSFLPERQTDTRPHFDVANSANYRQTMIPFQLHDGSGRVACYDPRTTHHYFHPSDPRIGAVGSPAMKPPLQPLQTRHVSSGPLQLPTEPRGPPSKPQRSGFALWCGNLPPFVQIADLKDYFSRGAADDIRSVFLIQKSNCAFINYCSEEACVAACNRFHNSRFSGRALVCRLRRSSPSNEAPAVSSPVSPSFTEKIVPQPGSAVSGGSAEDPGPLIVGSESTVKIEGENAADETDGAIGSRVPARYFILKSLTIADLEVSLRTNTWSTQPQNETLLSTAFKEADNVFLFYSVNKSGEYYGLGRMSSDMRRREADAGSDQESELSSKSSAKIVVTEATTTAPKGRIVDDSARGTLFWEADVVGAGENEGGESGREFSVEWLSTARIPFYQTRGLRNGMNHNREIKIARDGTECDPRIGRRLMQMFATPGGPPNVHDGQWS